MTAAHGRSPWEDRDHAALADRGRVARAALWSPSARGCPPASRSPRADIAAALARRRAGYGRGARMKFEQDEVEITGGRPARRDARQPGGDPGRQHRVAQVGDGDVARPGARRGPGRPGPQRAADPAPARPRRPGRDAEVRPRRRPAGAGAGQRPRDRRPGRAGRGRPAVPAPGVRHRDRSATWWRSARSARRTAPCRSRSDPAAGRRGPGALPGPGGQRGDAGGDRRGPQGRRHPRRGGRGGRLRPAARPGQPRALGPAARRRGWPPR